MPASQSWILLRPPSVSLQETRQNGLPIKPSLNKDMPSNQKCLGPRGMDKLIHQQRNVTISNDGATIISLLDIVHPAAKTLVDIAKSQDNEVGDGTTSVVLFAGELLAQSK
jgi:T-complex protein 1 subunit eta